MLDNIDRVLQLEERRVEVSQLNLEKSQLEIEIAELRKDVDSEQLKVEELKRSAQDFTAVKQEMTMIGIEPTDSTRFRGVIDSFRKYNYDPSKIMEVFAEVIDIKDALRDIKQQKQAYQRAARNSTQKIRRNGLW